MIDPQLLTFTGMIIGLTMLPGANVMLVIQNSLESGKHAGFVIAFGGGIANYLHALFSALGLSVIIATSVLAFEVVKIVGSLYLIFLGVRSLYRTWQTDTLLKNTPIITKHKPPLHIFAEGFITNLLSPEITLFYLTVVPQFLNANESVIGKALLLATIHSCFRLIWYGSIALFVGQVRGFLLRQNVRRGIQVVTGIFLVIFGLRLLTSRRVS